MLGKLMKHQTKAVYKILLIIHGAVILLAVLGCIFNALTTENRNNVFSILTAIFLVLYVLTLIFTYFATQYIMVSRFYKSMFTDEGYLTHTLPVKPWQLLWSNVIVYLAVSILDLVLLVCSFFMWMLPALRLQDFGTALTQAAKLMELSVPMMLFVVIGYLLIMLLYMIGSFYFSVCVGSMFSPHKVMASIVTFLVISVISQILGMVGLFIGAYSGGNTKTFVAVTTTTNYVVANQTAGFSEIMSPVFGSTLVVCVIIGIVYFAASQYIVSRKLNLE